MKAILLAAGLGTRLRPLTNSTPKCLVPINGEPLLGIWIKKLMHVGVSEILINTHYLADQVYDYINSNPYKDRIKLIHEDKLLGTGGTLVNNSSFWKDEECWVIHADNFFAGSLDGMLKNHRDSQDHEISLLLFHTERPQSCGIVTLNDTGLIQSFHEKEPEPPGNLASGALFYLAGMSTENTLLNLKATPL